MTKTLRIYHNARCSKSRAACTMANERGIDAEIINYLDTPPSREELGQLLIKLGMSAAQLLRTGEAVFKEHYAGRDLSEADCLQALLDHPILIERPIVVCGERAVVARPPERLLELLG